ncbi:hypothetical protein [Heyndrickxia acidicola]|uniref:DinB family protein n=1 Tax=Heyndrickxia acidicola TaxID=209389 RepID=A0ABU6MRC1_9BACI|nr:hypothetical protein [Heyndrickxia acidicola]MED1205772.1 hypothetical protein [Heyndrickxia acidicola]
MKNDLLRHFLASLSYRATQAIQEVPSHFSHLELGNEVRKPIEILNHITFLMAYTIHCFQEIPLEDYRKMKNWEQEVQAFYETAEKLDHILEKDLTPSIRTYEQLIQGPFSDAMTHVGQLSMMRRLADAPVKYENFMEADIRKGFIYPNHS